MRSTKIGGHVSTSSVSVMTPEQSRAARAWLGWSQSDLAKRANISLSTVRDYETGQRNPIPNNVIAMRRAIEEGGMTLLFDEGGEAVGIARVRSSKGRRRTHAC